MQTLAQLRSGQLRGVTHLRLSCELKEFPFEIFELADTLEKLDLSGNYLSSLPDEFGCLKKLKIVFFSDNLFTELPEVLSQCPELEMIGFKSNQITFISENTFTPNLRWLILTNNKLKALPESIGKCTRLQKVALAGNRLTELPDSMKYCRKIQLLRISANELKVLPEWLFELPELSWLAFSANPCSEKLIITRQLTEIPFRQLTLEQLLGEGASGFISKAVWQNGITREVAVKVFKGEVTSDGLPLDEMNACIAAGEHPNLIKVLGKICEHPQNKQGLVLELIPPVFKNLGHPPSLLTCTRDTFETDTSFSVSQIIRIAYGIASAAAHLHKNGISHGDLYAHNILTDGDENVLLGDFGAASYYQKEAWPAAFIQRIEVRAYACLLDDLLSHFSGYETGDHSPEITSLHDIRHSCFQENIDLRPDFETILRKISAFLPITN